ncbi:hypothetical protein BKA63DRAFT_497080 [Paraphoma chrysanthemicola]|nr:hypothetical protein BKA63DRAFT_497080 [Paraphoma chrysanthemicola]
MAALTPVLAADLHDTTSGGRGPVPTCVKWSHRLHCEEKLELYCRASYAFQSVLMRRTIDTDAVASWVFAAAALCVLMMAIPDFGAKQPSLMQRLAKAILVGSAEIAVLGKIGGANRR